MSGQTWAQGFWKSGFWAKGFWAETITPDEVVSTGGKGDNGRDTGRRSIYKPTGFIDRKRLNPSADPVIEARIEQSIEIAREIAAENEARAQAEITAEQQSRIILALNIQLQDALALQREVNAIIAEASRRRTEEDELIIILLAASL